ncbi:MAG: hypothetical protein OXU37_04845 [Thaumarchaeota archaeon]|nr:hypothetical protein [Nitrososphaerota archaeon]
MEQAAVAGQAMPPLRKVGSRKEFMDALYDLNLPPKNRKPGKDSRGCFTVLKTYILERNGAFVAGSGKRVSWDIRNTGVDDIKILNVWLAARSGQARFYMDTKDRRFLLLHTDDLAEDANDAIGALVEDGGHKLDHAWFHSSLMERWIGRLNGEFDGYAIGHGGLLRERPTTLKMEVSGTEARRVYRSIAGNKDSGGIMSHEAIEVSRGSRKSLDAHVGERISNTGYFSIKRGWSIEDHLHIVGGCKDEYAGMVGRVERFRMGETLRGGSWTYGGGPIEITYPKVRKLERFVDAMFSATWPFRLWGIKVRREDDYYSVPAVDLHEGSPIDFEITPTFMRVYTRRGSCGNTILRLLTNLQSQYSASTRCEELEC